MAQLIIHYKSLTDLSKSLSNASEKLSKYANRIDSKVAKRITNYSGGMTKSMLFADEFASKKTSDLMIKSRLFAAYSNSVSNFSIQAKETDLKIKNKIQTLTGSFQSKYGIKDSIISNSVSWLQDKLNGSFIGRLIKDSWKATIGSLSSAWDSIKTWYKYEGGKYIVKAVFSFALAIVGVASAVAAFLAGGAVIFVVAGIVLGVISAANAITNSISAGIAYRNFKKSNNASTAQRIDNIDEFTKWLRKSDSKWLHGLAKGIEIAKFTASVIMIVKGASDLAKGFKEILNAHGGGKQFLRGKWEDFGAFRTHNKSFGSFMNNRIQNIKNTFNPELFMKS